MRTLVIHLSQIAKYAENVTDLTSLCDETLLLILDQHAPLTKRMSP